jgi:hypothetical protein
MEALNIITETIETPIGELLFVSTITPTSKGFKVCIQLVDDELEVTKFNVYGPSKPIVTVRAEYGVENTELSREIFYNAKYRRFGRINYTTCRHGKIVLKGVDIESLELECH